MWNRREIENYLCYPEVLLAYAAASSPKDQAGPLFPAADEQKRQKIMQECISDLMPPVALRDRNDLWWKNVKTSNEFLDRLFDLFFKRLGFPNLMCKSDYHLLAELFPDSLIDSEVTEKLDGMQLLLCLAPSILITQRIFQFIYRVISQVPDKIGI